jgi:hypothetical protein
MNSPLGSLHSSASHALRLWEVSEEAIGKTSSAHCRRSYRK